VTRKRTDPTEEQIQDVLSIVRMGGQRETAAHCVGWTLQRLEGELARRADFRRDLLRAEAILEVGHLRNVQAAAEEKKNWRASVWWLERRLPQRYGPHRQGGRTPSAATGENASQDPGS
jgi:hypothetical protein